MAHTIDGDLSDWTGAERIDVGGGTTPGYELYAVLENNAYVFGIKSAQAMSTGTTIYIDVDQNRSTGLAGGTGADFYIDFQAGQFRLYQVVGGVGQLVNTWNSAAVAAGSLTAEFTVSLADLGETDVTAHISADVNNSVFLPTDFSFYTYIVTGNTLPAGDVTIDGLSAVGQTLTANTSALTDADGLGAFSYQWQRVTGSTTTNIAGATGTTYAPTLSDVGATLQLLVTYTDGHNTVERVTSIATATVAVPVTGRIYNDTAPNNDSFDNGEQVVGTTVTAPNSTGSTASDANGLYSIAFPGYGARTLTFSTGQVVTLTTVGLNTLDLVNGTEIWTDAASVILGANLLEAHLTGTADGDLTGNSLANVLIGNSGANVLIGAGGADILNGGAGNDTYVIGNDTSDTIIDSAGIDTIVSNVSLSLADYASIENLTLVDPGDIDGTGNDLDNVILGNNWNNTLRGGLGNDTLNAGLGDDVYVMDDGNDTIIDAGGNDTITSTITRSLADYLMIENLTLLGSDNIDGTGNAAVNIILGNSGNNVLDGGAGADTLNGGAGNDTYVLGADTTDTIIDSAGFDTITSTITRSIASLTFIEALTLLGSANIDATGNIGNNTLTGNDGNNILTGYGGNDTYFGGAGNDTYVLGGGGATITDTSGTNDTITSTISRSLTDYVGIETLRLLGNTNSNAYGDANANTLIGNGFNNILRGGSGADKLYGGLGNDIYDLGGDKSDFISDSGGIDTIQAGVTQTLVGHDDIERLYLTGTNNINGTGNNLANNLQGNAGNNVLNGQGGNDSIQGNGGADTLIGGAGVDYFVYMKATDSNAAAFDTITDFKDNGADKIKLTDVYGPTLGYQGTAAFTGIGQVRVQQSGADVIVYVNLDANLTTSEMQIKLAGTTLAMLSATDFVL